MKKDPAAQAMAKKRWAKVSPEARSQAGRKAAQARWGQPKPKLGDTWECPSCGKEIRLGQGHRCPGRPRTREES